MNDVRWRQPIDRADARRRTPPSLCLLEFLDHPCAPGLDAVTGFGFDSHRVTVLPNDDRCCPGSHTATAQPLEHQRCAIRNSAARDGPDTLDLMKRETMKTMIAGGWVLSGCAVAAATHVTSIGGWTVLVALTVLPPLVLLQMWKDPAQTLSESISEARR